MGGHLIGFGEEMRILVYQISTLSGALILGGLYSLVLLNCYYAN